MNVVPTVIGNLSGVAKNVFVPLKGECCPNKRAKNSLGQETPCNMVQRHLGPPKRAVKNCNTVWVLQKLFFVDQLLRLFFLAVRKPKLFPE